MTVRLLPFVRAKPPRLLLEIANRKARRRRRRGRSHECAGRYAVCFVLLPAKLRLNLLSRKHIPKPYNVPDPGVGHLYADRPKECRSPEALEREASKLGKRVAENILRHAPTFQLSQSLDDLRSSASRSEETLAQLEAVCDSELVTLKPIAQSCRYVDRFERLVAVYCGHRVIMVSGFH